MAIQKRSDPGVGLEPFAETEDMVKAIMGNVRMCHPMCFIFVCNVDSAANTAVFTHFTTFEEGNSGLLYIKFLK